MEKVTGIADKRRPVRVFGLTENELETLRQLALQKYGKASVSLLAKKLLQAQLVEQEEPELVKLPPQTATSTRQQTHYRSFTRKRPFLFGNSRRAAPQQRKRCRTRYCAGVYPQASVLVGSRSGGAVSVQLPAFEYRS